MRFKCHIWICSCCKRKRNRLTRRCKASLTVILKLAVQCSAVQCSAVQGSAVHTIVQFSDHFNTVQCSTVYNALKCIRVKYCTVL